MPRMTQAEVNAYNARRAAIRDSGAVGDCTDESELHQQIFDECRRRGWIALHGAMSERTHRTAGEPDFILITETRVHFIECKSRNGKLSLAQSAMHAHALKLGVVIHTVRSFEEFLSLL